MAAVLDPVRAFFAHARLHHRRRKMPGDVVAREASARSRHGAEAAVPQVVREDAAAAACRPKASRWSPRDPDGHVIGTVRLWNVEAGRRSAKACPLMPLLLGPLAVDCAHEGKGIGGALMRAAIAEAQGLRPRRRAAGGRSETYYVSASVSLPIRHSHLVMPGPFERRRFLALELKDGWLDGAAGVHRCKRLRRRRWLAEPRKAA